MLYVCSVLLVVAIDVDLRDSSRSKKQQIESPNRSLLMVFPSQGQ